MPFLLCGNRKNTLRKIAARLWQKLPLNFITVHYAYFITTCLLLAIVFWGAATPFGSVTFLDSLFLVVSGMTLAGLNTVNLSTLNTFQQFLLFLTMIIGSTTFVSVAVVFVRLRAFEKKFKDVEEERRRKSKFRRNLSRMDLPFGLNALGSRAASRTRGRTDGEEQNGLQSEVQSPRIVVEAADSYDNTPSPNRPRTTSIGLGLDARLLVPSMLEKREPAIAEKDETTESESQSSSSSSSPQPEKISTDDHVSFHPATMFQVSSPRSYRTANSGRLRPPSIYSPYARPSPSFRLVSPRSRSRSRSRQRLDTVPFSHSLTGQSRYSLSRNSQFHGLTAAERRELGGCEFRAVRLLAVLVPLYLVVFQLLGALALGAYVAVNRADTTRANNGLNSWWVGIFNAVSAFNNVGMSLLDANMVAFQTSVFMQLTMGLLILAGNTCFPIFLRLGVWLFWRLCPEKWDESKQTLRFLLDHPRRCYTHLFPARHTWWLVASVLCLNAIDWVALEVLNLNNPILTSSPSLRALTGLFQAVAVRSGGFYVVPISALRIGTQALFMLMMYVAVYPVAMTLRSSNVYEERSLGVYAPSVYTDAEADENVDALSIRSRVLSTFRHTVSEVNNAVSGGAAVSMGPSGVTSTTAAYFIQTQLRAQLSHDALPLALAVLVLIILETPSLSAPPTSDPPSFTPWALLFEAVSAYGGVGLSLGISGKDYSFCGAWRPASKVLMCVVMMAGRHRGLPVTVDMAVRVGEGEEEWEEEDAELRG